MKTTKAFVSKLRPPSRGLKSWWGTFHRETFAENSVEGFQERISAWEKARGIQHDNSIYVYIMKVRKKLKEI